MTDKVDSRISGAVLIYSLFHASINVLWLTRRGGAKGAFRTGALGAGLPALAEVWITSVDGLLNHRMSPRILGVPVAIPLLWFNVIFGSSAVAESALKGLPVGDEARGRLLAPTAALTATSLDLVMDCFGLDGGLWEWNVEGPYATDVEGTNGKKGIPLLNFIGWLTLVWAVVHLSRNVSGKRKETGERENPDKMKKTVILMLIPYYLISARWAIGNRKSRFLLYSIAFPALVASALTFEDG